MVANFVSMVTKLIFMVTKLVSMVIKLVSMIAKLVSMVTVLCLILADMADPKGHMDQVTHQHSQPQDQEDQSVITQSEFMHRVSLVRKNSLPFQHHTSLYVTP